MATTNQYLDIIIEDDMKYDIRIENAQMERYLCQKPFESAIFDIGIAANFTDWVTQTMS